MSMQENQLCYLNDNFQPTREAMISPQDRGFRFGDGVFETIPIYQSVAYQWDFHIERLQEGLKALQISPPECDWRNICKELLLQNHLTEGFVRIAISRGVGSKGYRPVSDIEPTIFIETLERSAAPPSARLWQSRYCKPPLCALPNGSKLAHGLNSTLALLEADANDCNEALMLSSEGEVCEAASGNLFWITDGELFTPALETGCLNGATRHAMLHLHHKPVQLALAPLATLFEADAVFLTNSNWGILPVESLNPSGHYWSPDHAEIATLKQAYRDDIDAYIQQHGDDWR